MAYQGAILYRLQEIDTTIQSHEKRLKEIDVKLGNDVRVKLAQAAVTDAENKLKPLQVSQRDAEHQIEATKAKQQRTETRLYSGTVKNPKEMQDMQTEIVSLKKRHSDLEDNLLEAMMAVEEAQDTLNNAEAALARVHSEMEADHADLLSEKSTIESEISTLNGERPGVTDIADAGMLSKYEALRPRKANRPMALLKDGTNCSACGVQVNKTIAREVRQQNDDLQTCNNCGRLLVYRP
ncbi:MAG: zinc ribbon domain-containing protein [Aggregatilineales bacterium]